MTIFSPECQSRSPETVSRLGPGDVLVLSAWCGLAAGELEVVARILYRALSSTQRLYLMTRHFVWLVPLINLILFLGFGLLLILAMRLWPRRAGWLSPRLLVAAAILPALALAGRKIYLEAWVLIALGVAIRVAPVLERHSAGWRRELMLSFPVFLGLIVLQAGWIFGGDRLKQWREDGRPLPAAGSPNVLLIVLDTVRADHLSLYGYPRPTTPNLERLAQRGIRFDQARAAAPWTLASHSTMFTGLWPDELAVEWTCPLRKDVPTLAEQLQSLGYATAGFAGNTFYCSYDSGLDRGFAHYQDYVLDLLSAARTSQVVKESLKIIAQIGRFLPISSETLRRLSEGERKDAHVVNREFLDWLTRRPEPRSPYFAFLNYVDAHAPYLLPPGAPYRLGRAPKADDDLRFLAEDWTQADKRRIPRRRLTLARDAYDNCLAYLDERLGELIDDLQRRGVLDQTLVIVTADHGEGLGEHQLFEHGESLYRPEVRVPLVIVLPADRGRSPVVVTEFVSLRDIATTIADFVRPGTESPFPGRSLLTLAPSGVKSATKSQADVEDVTVLSELASPNPSDPNQGRSPAYRGPLIALAAGNFVYIRNEGDGGEELFNQRDDPDELNNLAHVAATLPILQRFRDQLQRVKARAPAVGRRVAAPKVTSPFGVLREPHQSPNIGESASADLLGQSF
jgi:arylsulfatase A-like enzyme